MNPNSLRRISFAHSTESDRDALSDTQDLIPLLFPLQRTIHWKPKKPGAFEHTPIVVTQDVLIGVQNHVSESLEIELGGFLLGNRYYCPTTHQEYVLIDNYWVARHSTGEAASMEFSTDTWADFADQLLTKFRGKQVVGWYHSHPRMSVFLSPADVYIQNTRFPEPWMVALVLEPATNQGAFFGVCNGRLEPYQPVDFFEYRAHRIPESVLNWSNYCRQNSGSVTELRSAGNPRPAQPRDFQSPGKQTSPPPFYQSGLHLDQTEGQKTPGPSTSAAPAPAHPDEHTQVPPQPAVPPHQPAQPKRGMWLWHAVLVLLVLGLVLERLSDRNVIQLRELLSFLPSGASSPAPVIPADLPVSRKPERPIMQAAQPTNVAPSEHESLPSKAKPAKTKATADIKNKEPEKKQGSQPARKKETSVVPPVNPQPTQDQTKQTPQAEKPPSATPKPENGGSSEPKPTEKEKKPGAATPPPAKEKS